MRSAFGGCLLGCLLAFSACAGGDDDDGTTTPALSVGQTTDQTSANGETSEGGSTGGQATTTATPSSTDATSTADATSSPMGGSTTDDGNSTGEVEGLDPPPGQSSGGSGGGAAVGEVRITAEGITYRVVAPASAGPMPAMIVYSGTEGGATMTNNILSVASMTGNGDTVFGVLDGTDYFGDGAAGASVLDALRADYDVDNDRTYLLSESAGTTAGLQLGLALRQTYFAAYWANDVNAQATPALSADALGFAPYGNAGPGGDFADADAIVAGMMDAGYRTPPPAPYDGAGSDMHGSPQQFIAAMQWFPGKTRQ